MSQIQRAAEAIGLDMSKRALRRGLRSMRLAAICRSGVAAAEYAILAVGVVIVVGLAARTLMDPTTGAFVQVASTLASTQGNLHNTITGR